MTGNPWELGRPESIYRSQQHRKLLLSIAKKRRRPTSAMTLLQADLLEFDWSAANVVLVNATCFIGEMWDEIKSCLTKLQSGSRVIVISKHLQGVNDFKLLHQGQYQMSWGYAMARVYLKKAD